MVTNSAKFYKNVHMLVKIIVWHSKTRNFWEILNDAITQHKMH